jgi:hypothetical protein
MEARELARQAKRPSAKNAFEQAADYWLALAERVEVGERKSISLARPVVHSDRMPLVGYLLSVGMALFLGLVSLSAYLEAGRDSAAKLSLAPTTASLVSGTPSKHYTRPDPRVARTSSHSVVNASHPRLTDADGGIPANVE